MISNFAATVSIDDVNTIPARESNQLTIKAQTVNRVMFGKPYFINSRWSALRGKILHGQASSSIISPAQMSYYYRLLLHRSNALEGELH